MNPPPLFEHRRKKMLKEIRESRGMSQQDLTDKSGINKRMIQAYEQGYRDINGAKLSTLLTFANVLNCPINQIVTDESLIERINTYMNKL
jgi:transcriptional regulator with XRE-family HTH domain